MIMVYIMYCNTIYEVCWSFAIFLQNDAFPFIVPMNASMFCFTLLINPYSSTKPEKYTAIVIWVAGVILVAEDHNTVNKKPGLMYLEQVTWLLPFIWSQSTDSLNLRIQFKHRSLALPFPFYKNVILPRATSSSYFSFTMFSGPAA